MRLILFSILLSFGYGKIVFTPHSMDGGEKGVLFLHAIDSNGNGNMDVLSKYSCIDNAGHHLGYWCK